MKIEVYSISEFDIQFPNYQVVLLDPQVKYTLNTLFEKAVTQSIPAKAVNMMDYSMQRGDKVLDHALPLIEVTHWEGVTMGSLYQSMVTVIKQSITPLVGELGQRKYVITIYDGFTAALPFVIVGSSVLVFIFPPLSADATNSFAWGWFNFSATYRERLTLSFNLSTGVMMFFISVGIGTSPGRRFNFDPVVSGLLAFMTFLPVAVPYADGKILTQCLSGQGIFTALTAAIYSIRIYAWLRQNNMTIRLPREVPTDVACPFEILILVPMVIVALHPLNLFIETQTGMIALQVITHLLKPLVSASDSLPATLLSVLLCQVFWFAGIYGSLIVTGIMNPFWMANLSVNQAALAAGTALLHVCLQSFRDHYLLVDGVGSALPPAFLLLRGRVAHLRTIGKMGIMPSFSNINEPILFDVPIIMNPMLLILFVCALLVNTVLAYSATKLDWLARVVSLMPWTMPAPIGTSWVVNWTLSPVVMCFICMVMSMLMYLPFLCACGRSLLRIEE